MKAIVPGTCEGSQRERERTVCGRALWECRLLTVPFLMLPLSQPAGAVRKRGSWTAAGKWGGDKSGSWVHSRIMCPSVCLIAYRIRIGFRGDFGNIRCISVGWGYAFVCTSLSAVSRVFVGWGWGKYNGSVLRPSL